MEESKYKYTDEQIIMDARLYQTRSEWQEKSRNLYSHAMTRGLLEAACQHMTPLRKTWTHEQLREDALKYQSRAEWKKYSPAAVMASRRLNIHDQCCAHMGRLWSQKWDKKSLIQESSKFNSRKEWVEKSASSYSAAHKVGIAEDCSKHMENLLTKWTEEDIKQDALLYKTRTEWFKKSAGYAAAQYRGIIDSCCDHMEKVTSLPESELKSWLSSLGLEVSDHRIGRTQFDAYVPSKNIAIEYNGLYWHSDEMLAKRLFSKELSSLTKQEHDTVRKYHLAKTELAQSKEIKLIHVWEHEWLNRPEQVKNFLHATLGLGMTIGARKCTFKQIPAQEARDFCIENHIQGAPHTIELALGAYSNNTLIMVTTWASHHRQGQNCKVLNRMCGKYGVHVAGGLSKMSKLAYEHFQCPLKTWVHRTLSNGMSYEKAGWTKTETLKPDYFYIKNKKVHSKQSMKKTCIKSKFPDVYSADKTEENMCREVGMSRVWDCGKITFVYGDL